MEKVPGGVIIHAAFPHLILSPTVCKDAKSCLSETSTISSPIESAEH